jgi:hypothetical protein
MGNAHKDKNDCLSGAAWHYLAVMRANIMMTPQLTQEGVICLISFCYPQWLACLLTNI